MEPVPAKPAAAGTADYAESWAGVYDEAESWAGVYDSAPSKPPVAVSSTTKFTPVVRASSSSSYEFAASTATMRLFLRPFQLCAESRAAVRETAFKTDETSLRSEKKVQAIRYPVLR